jgi:hypothetical protein
MASRWDYLFEAKPIPMMDHLLEEVAKLLAKDLEVWPPPVQEIDLDAGGQFAKLLLEPGPKPSWRVYTEALKLARWDLTREFDAYDDYMRNNRYLELGLAPTDRLPLLFLSRWVVEQMLGLGESTQGRVTRKLMQQCLDRLESRMRVIIQPPLA